MSPTRTRALIATGTLAAVAGAAHAQVHVSQLGSFDPDGTTDAPFRTLHSAACASADNPGPVRFQAGAYGGLGTFIAPATLESWNGGTVVLGDTGAARTTFNIATFNSHLWGDALPASIISTLQDFDIIDPLLWNEEPRAAHIADIIASGDHDVFALQEVWDQSLWNTLRDESGFPHGFYGGLIDTENIGCIDLFGFCLDVPALNSGLGTLSRRTIAAQEQVFFTDETGDYDALEPFSSKGWIFTEIVKDGFTVGVYNTHLQAGPSSNAQVWSTRLYQIVQLGTEIHEYRNANPSNPVVIVGDINVAGSSGEYFQNLSANLDSLWMTDAAREIYCSRHLNGITTNNDVGLGPYFNPDDNGGSRLDYVLYSDSRDGSVEMVLRYMETHPLRAPAPMTDNGYTTDYLSDHYAVEASFDLIRR